MKRIVTIMVAAWCCLMTTEAQNVRVSQRIADALGSGKFYMKLKMQSLDFDEMDDEESTRKMQGIMQRLETEMAAKGKTAMTRMNMGGVSMVTLFANGHGYQLDEDSRTYTVARGTASQPGAMKLKFKQQGTCKVNGQPYYYDEYTMAGGTMTFYYNSDRVAIIDFGQGRGGAMALLSFSSYIPEHMYLCLDNRWKGKGSPAPPRCATPWKDNTKYEELACGESLSTPFEITDRHPVSQPVWLAQFGTSAPVAKPRTGKYTVEGIEEAVKEIAEKQAGMTDEQVERNVIDACTRDMAAVMAGKVSPMLIEHAVARALICPHSIALNDAATLLICGGCTDEATVILEEALEQDPENPFIVANLAECYLEQQQPKKAHQAIAKIIDVCPRGELHLLMGITLLAQDEMYQAIDEFCFALSYGFCDGIMASYLNDVITALREGIADEDNHSMAIQVLNRIYTEENLALLRQAVKREGDVCFNDAGTLNFNWVYTPEQIEPMYKSLEERADQLREKLADYEDKYKTAMLRSKAWRMGDPELMRLEGIDDLDDDSDNGDRTYVPRFWALWMLEAYHQLKLQYEDEDYTNYPDGDISKPREGWCPEEFTATDAFILGKTDEMNERVKKNNEQKEKAIDAMMMSSNGSMLAFTKLEYEYTQREFDITKESHEAIVRREKQYYNQHLKPAMEAYYETMNELAPYINDQHSRNYFVYRMKYELLSRFRQTYTTGAYHGSMINNTRYLLDNAIDTYTAALMEANQAKEAERLKHLKEVEEEQAALLEMQDTDENPLIDFSDIGKQLPDFNLSIGDADITPYTITFGKQGGHGFIEITDNKTGVTQGKLSGVGSYTRVIDTHYANRRAGNDKQWEKKASQLTGQSISMKLLGKLPIIGGMAGDAANAASAPYTSPININDRNEYTFQHDKEGRLLRIGKRKVTNVSSPMTGAISGTNVTDTSRHYGGAVTGSVTRRHSYITVSAFKIFKLNAGERRK